MNPDLEALRITERELENLTGLDINEIFVGGVFGGVCRPSVFWQRQRLILFCITELIVSVLVLVFSLPIGLLMTRNAAAGVQDLPAILQFLQITLAITVIVMVGWNLYMRLAGQRLTMLMHLLDEVDRYNEVIQAVDVLDRLEAVGHAQIKLIDRDRVLAALRVTRDSLVAGLMTERILRNSRAVLTRRYDLLTNIENNLVALRTLEVNDQANEYGQLLNEALQIGMSVQQEVQKFSR